MTITKSLLLVFGCTLTGTLYGGTLGYVVGQWFPDYYRAVFHRLSDGPCNPTSMGVGQGVSTGSFGGIVVGLVLVALFVLQESRVRVMMKLDAAERY
jgi:hypothetical protein